MSIDEQSGFPESMANGGEQAREWENRASRVRAAASRAVQTGKATAQRWGQQSRVVAVNATDHIKDDPVRSVVISFAVGLTLGALIGRLSGRQCQ
jgi:ElaB/YqjD/DUF883 family membrane-anchored ribosome-binding protein